MAAFRFRAAAALELRHQQETAAAQALARAEAHCRQAQTHVNDAQQTRHDAQERLRAIGRTGTDAWTIDWHRAWISRLTVAVETLEGEVEHRAREVQRAEALWREARRKRLALERMRERAWRRFQHAQLREEVKIIDELARLRFIADTARDPL